MKNLVPAIIVFSVMALVSCKKVEEAPKGVTGKWRLLSDSSYSSNVGYNGVSAHSMYNGAAADFYDFRTDGSLIIKEGAEYDTLHYTQQNNEVQRLLEQPGSPPQTVYFGPPLKISTLTNKSLVLSGDALTPGGGFGQIIRFTK